MRTAKVDVRLLPEEKEYLASMASRVNISTGEFIRRLVTGASLPVFGKHEAVKQLCKVNGDLARLGNLYKLSLNEFSEMMNSVNATPAKLEELINDIRGGHESIKESHAVLREKIKNL